MRNMDGALLGGLLVAGLSLSFAAEACSTDGWAGGVFLDNALADSPPTVSRYSEFCALSVIGQSYVQSNFASDTQYRARFYVLDGLTGSGDIDIFAAYSDESATMPLFKVSFDGSQFTFDATAAGGTSGTAASANGWNVIEFDWNSDAGTFDYWVNLDATMDASMGTLTSGAGTVEAVRLGAPNGFATQGGFVNFDAFESRRTTPVGTLLVGDANANGSLTIADVITIGNELNGTLASGQPDCNLNGSITIADVICAGSKL